MSALIVAVFMLVLTPGTGGVRPDLSGLLAEEVWGLVLDRAS